MTSENLDIVVPAAVGVVAIVGIVILSSFGHDSSTLNTLAGLFGTWAFGGGLYKIIQNNKKPTDKGNGK